VPYVITGEYLDALNRSGLIMLAVFLEAESPDPKILTGKTLPRSYARALLEKYHRGKVTRAARNRILHPIPGESREGNMQ
jgi:hypothetical protein